MNPTKFAAEQAGEDYIDVKRLVIKVVTRFHDRHPQNDFEELLAIGNEAFVKAYHGYDPSKLGQGGKPAKFATWVQLKIQYALKDYAKESYKRGREFPISNVDPEALGGHDPDLPIEQTIPSPIKFRLNSLIGEMSDDAAFLALMTLRTMTEENKGKHARETLFRSVLREFGWAAKRFWNAVTELREVLSS